MHVSRVIDGFGCAWEWSPESARPNTGFQVKGGRRKEAARRSRPAVGGERHVPADRDSMVGPGAFMATTKTLMR